MPISGISDKDGNKKITTSTAGIKELLDMGIYDSSANNVGDTLYAGNKPLTVRVATVGAYEYTGLADPGTATSAALWRILRETTADGTLLYAGGTGNFTNVWDNYAGLSYS